MDPQVIASTSAENGTKTPKATSAGATPFKKQPTGQKRVTSMSRTQTRSEKEVDEKKEIKDEPFSPPLSPRKLYKELKLDNREDWSLLHTLFVDPFFPGLTKKFPSWPIKKTTFPFRFDRKCITFVGRIGIEPLVTHMFVKNPTLFPFMFKIKYSNNNLFRSEPMFGWIDALSEASITLTYIGTHVPPLHQEFYSIHAMSPDPHCMDIKKAFNMRNNFETRKKIDVDFAYHDDAQQLFPANRAQMIYDRNKRFVNYFVSPAIIYRKEKEQKKREALLPASPRRVPIPRAKRQRIFIDEQKKQFPWMNDPEFFIEKPETVYRWDKKWEKKTTENKKDHGKSGKKEDDKKKSEKKKEKKEKKKEDKKDDERKKE